MWKYGVLQITQLEDHSTSKVVGEFHHKFLARVYAWMRNIAAPSHVSYGVLSVFHWSWEG